MSFEEANKIVREEILRDEELFYAYQANIAMAFKDHWERMPHENYEDIHNVANEAAKYFLRLWCVK